MIESVTDSQRERRHGGTPYQRAARWLLGAVIALILYGSLFPFEFIAQSDQSLVALIATLRFERASRGDVVANLLLYVPLGLCLVSALPRRWSAVLRFALTVAAGVLLSLAVELLQTMEPARVSSLTDIVLNAAGTAIGALGALIYISVGTHLRIPGLLENRPAPVPLGFILLWLSYRLAPFVPTLDWQKVKDSLKPVFLSPSLDGFEALRFLTGWLVVAYAARRIWRREYALLALILLAAGTQFGRVFIVGKALNLSELVGLAAMFALLPLINRQPTALRLLILSIALAAIVLVQGLEPWELAPETHAFSWVPFMNSLSDSLEVNIGVLLEKCFWYASLVWLLAQRSGALAASAIGVAFFVGAIEVAQMWLPGRSAEITDPLLVLAAGGLLGLLTVKGDRAN